MSRVKPKASATVAAQIAMLEGMKWNELKEKWNDLFGREPGINNRRYVVRRLTHRIQEDAARLRNPDLLTSNERRLQHLLDTGIVRPKPTRVRAGTVLTRHHQGVLHSVRVLEDKRFEYRGKQYRSLSIIAREITGTRWSGPAFFGLRPTSTKENSP